MKKDGWEEEEEVNEKTHYPPGAPPKELMQVLPKKDATGYNCIWGEMILTGLLKFALGTQLS